MKRTLIILLAIQTILGFSVTTTAVDCCGQGHNEYSSGDLLYRDVMYTTEGGLLLRHVLNAKENWFQFQECLIPPNGPVGELWQQGQTLGACYDLSPKYANTADVRLAIGKTFGRHLHNDVRSIKYFQTFSKWVLPFLTAWAFERSFVAWNRFYSPAFAAIRTRTGIVATLLSVVASVMGGAVWNAWTGSITSIEESLKQNNQRAEDQSKGAFKGQDIYLLVRTALRQAFADQAVRQYRIIEKNTEYH